MNPTPPSQLRRNLVACTLDGLFATPHVFINTPGNILLAALATKVFLIDKAMYGLIAALPFVSNGIQLLLMPLLAGRLSARKISLGFGWANLAVWIALIVSLPFFPKDDAMMVGRLLLLYLGVASLFGALGGVGWTSWVQEWIPRRIRGKYFGLRNRVANLANVGFLLIVGVYLEYVGNNLNGYIAVFILAGILRVIGFYYQQSVHSKPSQTDAVHAGGWIQRLRDMAAAPMFLRFVIFGALMTFWMNFTGPFGPVFMYEQLDLSVARVTLLVVIGTLGSAISWPIWGHYCDRLGCKPVIFASIILWESQNYCWAFITKDFAWILFPMWFWGGLTATGFFLGNFNMLLKLIPRASKTTGISINLAITSLAAAMSPVLAGFILDWVSRSGHDLDMAYRIGFFVKSSAVLLTLLLLRKVVEPEKDGDLRTLFGALRSVRQVYHASGLPAFSNIHPAKIRRKK
ncbi:MAG: MFS transporter [Verrucomicrobiota bacterium]|nr:MFS transporter [Verrucomicrobiota bacterium]